MYLKKPFFIKTILFYCNSVPLSGQRSRCCPCREQALRLQVSAGPSAPKVNCGWIPCYYNEVRSAQHNKLVLLFFKTVISGSAFKCRKGRLLELKSSTPLSDRSSRPGRKGHCTWTSALVMMIWWWCGSICSQFSGVKDSTQALLGFLALENCPCSTDHNRKDSMGFVYFASSLSSYSGIRFGVEDVVPPGRFLTGHCKRVSCVFLLRWRLQRAPQCSCRGVQRSGEAPTRRWCLDGSPRSK